MGALPSSIHKNEPNCLKMRPVQGKASTERKPQISDLRLLSDWVQPSLKPKTLSWTFQVYKPINSKPVGAIFIEVKQLCQDHTANECGGNNQTQVTLIPFGATAHVLNSCSMVAISIYLGQSSRPQHLSHCLALTWNLFPSRNSCQFV